MSNKEPVTCSTPLCCSGDPNKAHRFLAHLVSSQFLLIGGPRTLVSVISFNTRGADVQTMRVCWRGAKGESWLRGDGEVMLQDLSFGWSLEEESFCHFLRRLLSKRMKAFPGLLEWEMTSYHTGYFVITLFFFNYEFYFSTFRTVAPLARHVLSSGSFGGIFFGIETWGWVDISCLPF